VAGLFYHDVLAALSESGVRFVVLIRMKQGTGRSQDASDVEALRRVQEVIGGQR
jgi:hypothetical protein